MDATYHHVFPFSIHVREKPITTVYDVRCFTVATTDRYDLSFQGPVKE